MSIYEAEQVIRQYNQDYQNRWEQTRYIAFVQACSAGVKIKKPKDLMAFSWEEIEKPVQLTPEQEAQERASLMQTYINKQNGQCQIVQELK